MQAEAKTESEKVLDNRYWEALDAGLHPGEAHRFAHSTTDVELLRKLVAGGCPARLIAAILL